MGPPWVQCPTSADHSLAQNQWLRLQAAWPVRVLPGCRQRRAAACLRSLCSSGVDVNARVESDSRHTALHLAVRYGALPAVDVLASHGADVNAADRFGVLPLHMAAGTLDLEMAASLIRCGADVGGAARRSGATALHMAVLAATTKAGRALPVDLSCVSELLAHGASPDAQDKAGRTPLHEACQDAQEEAADMLLGHGADVNIRTALGENCLFLFLDREANLWRASLLGKLLSLTYPFSITNSQGLLPRGLLLSEHRRQRDMLLQLCKQPLGLQHICRIHIYRQYGEKFRQNLKEMVPEKLYDFSVSSSLGLVLRSRIQSLSESSHSCIWIYSMRQPSPPTGAGLAQPGVVVYLHLVPAEIFFRQYRAVPAGGRAAARRRTLGPQEHAREEALCAGRAFGAHPLALPLRGDRLSPLNHVQTPHCAELIADCQWRQQVHCCQALNQAERANFEALTLKHHTSKLSNFSDLIHVETFGFRGEALSSLCALSDLSVVTCHESVQVGTRMVFDHSGKLAQRSPHPRQQGTTVTLQQLFSTLPVRHKEFQRNIKKEYTKMIHVLQSYCIISTGVRITCTNQVGQGKRSAVLCTNGSHSMKDNIGAVFGPKQLQSLIPFQQQPPTEMIKEDYGLKGMELPDNFFTVSGFVSRGDHGVGRSATDRQFFFINNRPCDPSKVSKLVNEVYHMFNRHQYPFVALNISVASDCVDVNVTPDKRQVFLQEEKLLLATLKSTLVSMYETGVNKISLSNPPLPMPYVCRTVNPSTSVENISRAALEAEDIPEPSLLHTKSSLNLAGLRAAFSLRQTPGEGTRENSSKVNHEGPAQKKLHCFFSSPESSSSSTTTTTTSRPTIQSLFKHSQTLKCSPMKVPVSEENRGEGKADSDLDSGRGSVVSEHSSSTWTPESVCGTASEFSTPDTVEVEPRIKSESADGQWDEAHEPGELSERKNLEPSPSPGDSSSSPGSKRARLDERLSTISTAQSDSGVQAPSTRSKVDAPIQMRKRTVPVHFSLPDLVARLQKQEKERAEEGLKYRRFRAKISPGENQSAEDELKKEISKDMFKEMEIIGQFNMGFIIAKLKSDIFIIDQHATDEKYNFEMLQQNTVLQGQRLIAPQKLHLPAVSETVLIENLEIFQKNGFDFIIDEEAQVMERVKLVSLPTSKNWTFGPSDIEEMIFMLSDSPGVMCRPSRVRQMFASRACRKSVMIGTPLSTSEMKKLLGHMGDIEQPVVSEPPLAQAAPEEDESAQNTNSGSASSFQPSLAENPVPSSEELFYNVPAITSIIVENYPSGNVYEGQWKNNARHGDGRMKWNKLGQQYSGQWENGLQHGQGTHTWFLKRILGSQYPLRNEYVGEFVQGLRQGRGKFYYASGALYDGEWQGNKKHGQGKFTFKNGRTFEGEFVDDHMAEFPAFSMDGTTTPDLSGIRTQTPPCGKGERPRGATSSVSGSSVLGPDMALEIQSLLENLPEAQKDIELRQVEFAVLRHITELRTVYSFYGRLGHQQSLDNTFLLTRMQFWRLLKDCNVHHHGITLAQMDRFISGKCAFFCNSSHAVIAANYTEKCWEIYQAHCRLNSSGLNDRTMTMRHFIWMLKDLGLYDDELTTGKVLEILSAENPAAYTNLDVEMTFLDFFEALLACAEEKSSWSVGTPSECLSEICRPAEDPGVLVQEECRDSPILATQRTSPLVCSASVEMEGYEGESRGDTMCLRETVKWMASTSWSDGSWIRTTHLFFSGTLFPAFERSLLLQREVQEERLRRAAQARIALAKAKRAARPRRKRQREEEEEEETERADAQGDNAQGDNPQHPPRSPAFLPTPGASASCVTNPKLSRTASGTKKKRAYRAKSQLMSPRIFMRSGWTEVRDTLAVLRMWMVLFSARRNGPEITYSYVHLYHTEILPRTPLTFSSTDSCRLTLPPPPEADSQMPPPIGADDQGRSGRDAGFETFYH
ncbi:hypothetical protein AAFF_G00082060 [Aldrovandia affinis]|uniref:Uncharacterized protein n=1 Tax=Aldrovandia affinis TaxID=143900 RepID=A0AAD7WZB5_9TELE|nr:hypothetical protein AAFF_G00082060 [Aldrovandia affinis]